MPVTPMEPTPRSDEDDLMRYESSVTSLSWIPSEAVTGGTRVAFDTGVTHYDDPPPGELGDIEELRLADRFRFANVLRAWIDVDGSGAFAGCGSGGGGLMGSTTVRLGGLQARFQAIQLPDRQQEPQRGDGGGRRWCGPPGRSPCKPAASPGSR